MSHEEGQIQCPGSDGIHVWTDAGADNGDRLPDTLIHAGSFERRHSGRRSERSRHARAMRKCRVITTKIRAWLVVYITKTLAKQPRVDIAVIGARRLRAYGSSLPAQISGFIADGVMYAGPCRPCGCVQICHEGHQIETFRFGTCGFNLVVTCDISCTSGSKSILS